MRSTRTVTGPGRSKIEAWPMSESGTGFSVCAHDESSAAMALAISLSIRARSVTPTLSRRLGRNRRKCTKRSRLTFSRRSSSASGSAWSSTRRLRSGHSSSPQITSAADCLPRLSPPAASPARNAAMSRRGKESAARGQDSRRAKKIFPPRVWVRSRKL